MFDIFLVLLVIAVLYYHMTHCGKCKFWNTRCELCNYGKEHGKINKEVLKDMKKIEEKYKHENI